MSESEYERGMREGEIRARLEDHGRRLDSVNGSIALTGDRLLALTEAVSKLTEIARASEERAQKYLPIIDNLEQSRLLGLKRWHIFAAAFALVGGPEILVIVLHAAGIS